MQQQRMKGLMIGGGGLIVGGIIGASVISTSRDGGISGVSFGLPELLIILVIVLFIGFWVALIAGAVWGVRRLTRQGYAGRLEDLPADFDDWHRRAHERMRERGADDPDRRG